LLVGSARRPREPDDAVGPDDERRAARDVVVVLELLGQHAVGPAHLAAGGRQERELDAVLVGVLAVGVGRVRAHAEDDDVVEQREPVGVPERAPLVGTRRVEVERVEDEDHRPPPGHDSERRRTDPRTGVHR
jgi:hypothetical protein